MSKNATREPSWRRDSIETEPSNALDRADVVDQRLVEATSSCEVNKSVSATVQQARAPRGFQRWLGRFRPRHRLARRPFAHGESSVHAEFRVDEIIHDFAESLIHTTEPSEIVMGLVLAARQLTGATRIEVADARSSHSLIHTGSEAIEHGESAKPIDEVNGEEDALWKIPLGQGSRCWGLLAINEPDDDRPRRAEDHPVARPLKTLCTLAALALESASTNRFFEALEEDDLDDIVFSEGSNPSELEEDPLRDATYLNVVLPYALNQTARHREPLSLISIGIDRLSPIRETFGVEMVGLAMKHVGEIIVKRLRTSDVVSRMEDDRILAMLPHATASNALRIAHEMRALVEESCRELPDMPALTVSIGIASFPTHAKSVLSLLNAADEAMFRAEQFGRNRVIIAGQETD